MYLAFILTAAAWLPVADRNQFSEPTVQPRGQNVLERVFAQAEPAQPKAKNAKRQAKKKQQRPVFEDVVDDPKLPRVLIIGDSISIGYTDQVRELLKGVANVHRAKENCGPTSRGVERIDKWLGDGKWDVIHFNFGLHDLKYVDDEGKNSTPQDGKLQIPLDVYQKNLQTIVEKMKATGAKLIFATTTPVPEGEPMRKAGSEEDYNKAALAVLKEHDVAVNDLCAFSRSRLEKIQRPANVHFTPDGYKELASQVAAEIRRAL